MSKAGEKSGEIYVVNNIFTHGKRYRKGKEHEYLSDN